MLTNKSTPPLNLKGDETKRVLRGFIKKLASRRAASLKSVNISLVSISVSSVYKLTRLKAPVLRIIK